MQISRRNLLRSAAALPLAGALDACAGGATGATVAIAQAVLADATNIVAGANAILGLVSSKATVPAATVAAMATYAGQAASLLGQWTAGSIVPITSVQTFFTDAEAVAADAAVVLPGNPYVLAIQALLPVLAAAWGMVAPAAATQGGMTPDRARALLSGLPRPHLS